jgi:hypothetical protein
MWTLKCWKGEILGEILGSNMKHHRIEVKNDRQQTDVVCVKMQFVTQQPKF